MAGARLLRDYERTEAAERAAAKAREEEEAAVEEAGRALLLRAEQENKEEGAGRALLLRAEQASKEEGKEGGGGGGRARGGGGGGRFEEALSGSVAPAPTPRGVNSTRRLVHTSGIVMYMSRNSCRSQTDPRGSP